MLATFTALQQDANTPPISKLTHKLAVNGDTSAGDEVLRILRDPNASLATETAVECLDLLIARVDAVPAPLAGELVGGLLRVSRGAREHIAGKLSAELLAVLERLGPDAVDGAVTVLLDGMAWPGKEEENKKALRLCFRWFLSRLGAGGAEMARSVARLLASKADELHSYVDSAGLEQLLMLLDVRALTDLRSHATLATAKFAETAGDVGQSMIGKFVASRVGSEDDDDLRLAYSVAAAIFPLVPQFAAQLFLTEGFVEGLVESLHARRMAPVRVPARRAASNETWSSS